MENKLKILIVDDSRVFRMALEKCLSGLDDIEVIGSAFNGENALELIRSNRPDLVTLDVEMPGLDGLETLAEILKLNEKTADEPPVGVIMLSAFTKKGADITIEALGLGAFDFQAKPESNSAEEGMDFLKIHLLIKIRHFVSRRIYQSSKTSMSPRVKLSVQTQSHPPSSKSYDAILIGVSTGGPKALMNLLPSLCDVTDVPIFIVQHMPPTFTKSLADGLNKKCRHTVVEAVHGDAVQKNFAYVAPGGEHMVLRKSGAKIQTVMNNQEPENGCCPSVDVLFRSATPVYGGRLLVIVLTGMGKDGTKGIAPLKRAGAKIIAQDEASSVVWGMPGSAVASGQVDLILPLDKIASTIASF